MKNLEKLIENIKESSKDAYYYIEKLDNFLDKKFNCGIEVEDYTRANTGSQYFTLTLKCNTVDDYYEDYSTVKFRLSNHSQGLNYTEHDLSYSDNIIDNILKTLVNEAIENGFIDEDEWGDDFKKLIKYVKKLK